MAAGEFSGDDVYFANGSAVLSGEGILNGVGNASGDSILCTAVGSLQASSHATDLVSLPQQSKAQGVACRLLLVQHGTKCDFL